MVLNQELEFGIKDWVLFSILMTIVIGNVVVPVSGIPLLQYLYAFLLAWSSFPIIAVTLYVHSLSGNDSAGTVWRMVMIILSILLTGAVPVLVSRSMSMQPVLLFILYLESFRFCLKTLHHTMMGTGGRGANFMVY